MIRFIQNHHQGVQNYVLSHPQLIQVLILCLHVIYIHYKIKFKTYDILYKILILFRHKIRRILRMLYDISYVLNSDFIVNVNNMQAQYQNLY
jgi:hypothetical protein